MDNMKRRHGIVLVFKDGLTPEEILAILRGVDPKGRKVQDIIHPEWLPGEDNPIRSFNPEWGDPAWYVP